MTFTCMQNFCKKNGGPALAGPPSHSFTRTGPALAGPRPRPPLSGEGSRPIQRLPGNPVPDSGGDSDCGVGVPLRPGGSAPHDVLAYPGKTGVDSVPLHRVRLRPCGGRPLTRGNLPQGGGQVHPAHLNLPRGGDGDAHLRTRLNFQILVAAGGAKLHRPEGPALRCHRERGEDALAHGEDAPFSALDRHQGCEQVAPGADGGRERRPVVQGGPPTLDDCDLAPVRCHADRVAVGAGVGAPVPPPALVGAGQGANRGETSGGGQTLAEIGVAVRYKTGGERCAGRDASGAGDGYRIFHGNLLT